jgi:hypothetical protein
MATKRTRKSRNLRARVTPAAVAAYRAKDYAALHLELRLAPWEVSPLDAWGDCPWPSRTGGGDTWDQAVQLRAELEAAASAPKAGADASAADLLAKLIKG